MGSAAFLLSVSCFIILLKPVATQQEHDSKVQPNTNHADTGTGKSKTAGKATTSPPTKTVTKKNLDTNAQPQKPKVTAGKGQTGKATVQPSQQTKTRAGKEKTSTSKVKHPPASVPKPVVIHGSNVPAQANGHGNTNPQAGVSGHQSSAGKTSGHANALSAQHGTSDVAMSEHVEEPYEVVRFDFEFVKTPLIISAWLLVACIGKLMFHLSKRISAIFPDSSLLIALGVVVGIILMLTGMRSQDYRLLPNQFFLFLLPPIVFDAGYFMPNRAFFDNIGAILTYAVIGTLWNTFTIGVSLWAIGQTGLFSFHANILEMLTFSSLISAVDPVAVLVVFEEIHVNAMLYITVFGESLLNDAVTVVLYEMFEKFAEIGVVNLTYIDYLKGFAAFFIVSLGGVLVGIFFAALSSFTTRFTRRVRALEPLFVFLFAYLSYLVAYMFHLSAILAIVFCGISMRKYVEANISERSKTTVQYLLKMISVSSEAVIFMFLGLSTVTKDHCFDVAFVLLTVLFCIVFRAIGTGTLTFILNKTRLQKINKVDQFIMVYGGLRGAIAYGLVSSLHPGEVSEDTGHVNFAMQKCFLTATIVVIYFTVFVQGMTIKPLVNYLKVQKAEHHEATMCSKIFGRNIDSLTACVEAVAGAKSANWRRMKFSLFTDRWIKPILLREVTHEQSTSIKKVFTELNIKAAVNHVEQFGNFSTPQLDSKVKKLSKKFDDDDEVDVDTILPDDIPILPTPILRTKRCRLERQKQLSLDIDDLSSMASASFLMDSPGQIRKYSNTNNALFDDDDSKSVRRRSAAGQENTDGMTQMQSLPSFLEDPMKKMSRPEMAMNTSPRLASKDSVGSQGSGTGTPSGSKGRSRRSSRLGSQSSVDGGRPRFSAEDPPPLEEEEDTFYASDTTPQRQTRVTFELEKQAAQERSRDMQRRKETPAPPGVGSRSPPMYHSVISIPPTLEEGREGAQGYTNVVAIESVQKDEESDASVKKTRF